MSATSHTDYSQPIATLLRTETAAAHEEAEHSQGAGWLTRGELDKEEYIRFLIMLHYVYETLEQGLDRHAANPVLAPTYNPTLFARTQSLSADIAHLLDTPESSWQSHPITSDLVSNPPQPFSAYTSRLRYLADHEPSALLAHAYVRYLGDLSGGQFIKRRVARAYGLEGGEGLSFYDFKQLGGNASGTIGDMKKIKEWYREGMNVGAGDDAALKERILDEAQIAFQLNTGLFTTLKPPKAPSSSEPTDVALGVPMTPIEGSRSPSPLRPGEVTKSIGSSFPLSSVAAFLIAVAISQVIIVFGGFTLEKSSADLAAVLNRLSSVFAV